MTKSRFASLCLAASLTAGASAASAQYAYPSGGYGAPRYEGRSGYAGPAGQYCEKLCVQDTSPCDPPEFKRADGRCSNPLGGMTR